MMDVSQLAVSVDTQRHGAMVVIRPHIENPVPLTLQYRMTVSQKSVSLNLPAGGTCQVHLQVFQQDTLVKEVDSACGGADSQ